ncbi:cell wall-active antibiotics response protein LiaF [Cohnella rhizosphaerae]|uniref:Cell wall-active antibiotics response protein LiaF n=1 Tax=Cohnella rhizosphaerae TaxID=1457232 RepID=A0A9X4KPV5_9BACL|nr:cell wall-active antibiotics response protein LiaF [Cohnella rhizosphaerae]MDG0808562.1 cell wall-active antibiotics response protein LiaF [Cohnella rhizosphaerae]
MRNLNLSKKSLVFIAAGLYLAVGAAAGFATINAAILLWLGIERYRQDRSRLSVAVIAVSAIVLVVNQIGLVLAIGLILAAIYYLRVRPSPGVGYVSRPKLILNMRQDRPGWVLRSMGCWHLYGEVRLDLTGAVPEDNATNVVLQGIVGDIEIVVPEDYGVLVEANVLLGQVTVDGQGDGGMMRRMSWSSPGLARQDQQIRLQFNYIVGNIRIRPI